MHVDGSGISARIPSPTAGWINIRGSEVSQFWPSGKVLGRQADDVGLIPSSIDSPFSSKVVVCRLLSSNFAPHHGFSFKLLPILILTCPPPPPPQELSVRQLSVKQVE